MHSGLTRKVTGAPCCRSPSRSHESARPVDRGLGVNPHGISLNQLVRAREHRLGDREAQCLRGFQVDHQLELGRLLDWQIGRFGTGQDFSYVNAQLLECAVDARSIAN